MCKNILVADDDKGMLSLYSRLFSGQDYAITLADSFSEAAFLIGSNNYDLLITDFMFPDGLGTELIRLFKERRATAKSLLVSGSPEAREMLTCSEPSECFDKPFDVRNFMDAVTKALA